MKAILIDDEPLALDFLEKQIKKISDMEIIGKHTHFNDSQDFELLKEVDIVFLDIEMPETNGLELAEQMLEVHPALTIIFVTAYKDYAVDAFSLDALDYLLKPVQLNRLQNTLERIEKKLNNQTNTSPKGNHKLRINVCRELTFQLKNDKKETIHWRTAKTQELFLYLLHYRGKTVRKSELVDVFWPEFEEQKGYAQLYTTIYHIRKALSPFSNHFSLTNVLEGYILNTNNIFIDIVEWEQRMAFSHPLTVETIVEYETNMNLYAGSYLQEYDYLWAEAERYRLEQLWIKAAYQLANFYVNQNYLEEAEKWFVKIYTLRPEEEDAHFSLMKLYADLDLGLLVNHQYHLLKNALNELDSEVSPTIQKWFYQWNKNRTLFVSK